MALADISGALKKLPSLGQIGQAEAAVGDAITGTVSKTLFFGLGITEVVMIILGLLLIAAGIFSFDRTRELITSGVRTAAAAA
jgi:hypothetical protein